MRYLDHIGILVTESGVFCALVCSINWGSDSVQNAGFCRPTGPKLPVENLLAVWVKLYAWYREWTFVSYLWICAGFFDKELKTDGIAILDTGDNPEAPAPREMSDLEVNIFLRAWLSVLQLYLCFFVTAMLGKWLTMVLLPERRRCLSCIV